LTAPHPVWISVEIELALVFCALVMWAFAAAIGKAFGSDKGTDDPDTAFAAWVFRWPFPQQPDAIEFQVKMASVFLFLAGCGLLALHAGWIFHTLMGQ